MALDSGNVRVARTGAISVGTAEAGAPTDADTELGAGWTDLGWIGEDGVTETRDRTTEKIRGWQNGETVREVVTEATLSYVFKLVETKKETVELFYGATVDDTDGSLVVVPSATGGRQRFVIDVVDGDEYIRTYIPAGEITEVGEQVYAAGEAVGYEVTIVAYPDVTAGGAAVKFYSALEVTVPVGG